MVCRSHRTSLKHYSLFLLGQLYHTLEKHEDIDDENALYAKPVKQGKVLIIFIYIFITFFLYLKKFTNSIKYTYYITIHITV